jgi:hypothetical protein
MQKKVAATIDYDDDEKTSNNIFGKVFGGLGLGKMFNKDSS